MFCRETLSGAVSTILPQKWRMTAFDISAENKFLNLHSTSVPVFFNISFKIPGLLSRTSARSISLLKKAESSVQVYDVATGELLNKQRLQNKGCPTVFLNMIPVGTMGPKGRFSDSLGKWAKNIK